jgi:hypothetical protein
MPYREVGGHEVGGAVVVTLPGAVGDTMIFREG